MGADFDGADGVAAFADGAEEVLVVTGGTVAVLTWRERGGPKVDGVGAGSMGTMLVEGFATRDLGGSVRMAFPEDGAVHVLEFPVRDANAAPPAAGTK